MAERVKIDIFEKIKCVPNIPNNVAHRGIPYYGKCACGGTIKAVRNEINGHINAHCDKCRFGLIE